MMFTKIFKRFSIQAILMSFFLSLCANIFNLYWRAGADFYDKIFYHGLILTFNVLLFIFIIYLSDSKRLNLNFGASHLLSFPLCILLIYQGDGNNLNAQKVILALSLLLAANIFSKEFSERFKERDLFNLGVFFTIVSYINIYLSLFFISIIFLLPRIIEKRKAFISLVIGVISTISILITISYYKTGQIFYDQPDLLNKNFTYKNAKEYSEFVWVFTVIILFVLSIAKKNKRITGERSNNEKRFMLLWLLISFIFRLYGLYQDSTLWLLSFIPSAYLLGNLFEALQKEIYREGLFYILLLLGITSKFV